jgi:hypothetical protein
VKSYVVFRNPLNGSSEVTRSYGNHLNHINIQETDILTTVLMLKSTIFWDTTPCSPLKVNRRFGGTYRLYFQGRKISRARNQRESSLPPAQNLARHPVIFACIIFRILCDLS